MKKILLSLILSISLFGEVILVGNSNCKLNSLSRIELKNLYLGLSKASQDEKINVLNRDDTKLYEYFVTKELKKSVVSMETYWVRMLFSGRAKPPKQISYSQWLDLNSSNECLVVYIDEKEYKKGFKRIAIVE